MGRIRVLPTHVVNQIAAGEVVDRPASVVKELVENAIDAGARRVEVRLFDGGRGRIEVHDDGLGMDAEDLAAAFLPHATSKLSDVEDLVHIASLGFRGEALASVGSVSRASISSRPRDAAVGATVEDREGVVSPVRPAAAAPGTVVVVEGLFAGVPARRKFLRSAATELGHAADCMSRFALAFPEIGFSFSHEGRLLWDAPAGESRLERVARCCGDDVARSLIPVSSARGEAFELEALVSPPGVSRGDARWQQTYLNGRFLRDKVVAHALREAYRDLVPPGGRQPIAFLFLTCDPARVDVNVHPTKSEVRWRDSAGVHETVRRTVRAALEASRPGVDVSVGIPRGAGAVDTAVGFAPDSFPLPFPSGHGARFAATHAAAEHALTQGSGRTATRSFASPGWETEKSGGASAICDAPGHDHAAMPSSQGRRAADGGLRRDSEVLRPLGQVHDTYLVFESPEGLVLVDQHALHERVLFDRITHRLEHGALEVQHLLVPAVVSLSGAEVARVEEEKDLFERLGWIVEPFGTDAVAVRACPAVLRRPDPEAMLREVLGLLEAGRRDGLARAALLSAVVDRLACRAAVMAGDVMHPDEVLSLLEQAEQLNHSHSCPHGRPTRLVLSKGQLERWFHR